MKASFPRHEEEYHSIFFTNDGGSIERVGTSLPRALEHLAVLISQPPIAKGHVVHSAIIKHRVTGVIFFAFDDGGDLEELL